MSDQSLYDRDFYAWSQEQAALLRSRLLPLRDAGELSDVDIDHIAEEIESMGRAEKRELINRLAVLLLHLLKWQFQPVRRGASWQATIRVQRRDLTRHLKDNPSLKGVLPEAIADAYGDAVIEAAAETGLPESTFPASCPWSFEKIMDEGFWPETVLKAGNQAT